MIASLLTTRRFLPLFVTQFLGALNDNLFRQSLIMLITFRLAESLSVKPALMNNLAIGLFILPYFLFSALAGQLADKYEKSGQIFWIKVWEICLMLIGAIGFYHMSLPLLMATLAGLGLQSTFFGPIKYGILPDLMKKKELVGANALIEAATFIAILLGTIIGGLLILGNNGIFYVVALTFSVAVVGTLSGSMVPKAGKAAPDLKLSFNIFTETGRQLKKAWQHPVARPAITGISWIWLYGSIYMTQIPVLVKERLHGDETVVTLFLACFSLGVGAGSFLSSKLLKGRISADYVVHALFSLMLVSLLLCFLLPGETALSGALTNVSTFLASPSSWLILIVLIVISAAAGLWVVPLYAILQTSTDRNERSRTIAANNIVNSGFMAGGALLATFLLGLGLSSTGLLLVLAFANLLLIPASLNLRKQTG